MEPYDPISRLAACCFGRRPRSDAGFKTQALRNQYYYSPSMAHIGPGNTTTWPMAQTFGAQEAFALAAPANQPQPYILFAQPMILTSSNPAQLSVPAAQGQAGPPVMGMPQASLMHKVSSMAASQYAIYANSICTTGGAPTAYTTSAIYEQSPQLASTATAGIYESPRMLNGLARNRSVYLGPIAELTSAPSANAQSQRHQIGQTRPRGLNREIYKQLEVIEKQVDLTRDMDLVERHGLVITRAIEARSLAPHLSVETMRRYQEHFLVGDEYVIRFIEIIKRPGQTLGLYIRLVHFEAQQLARPPREGIVITKIESNSPVYSSQVLHIGDEILSINLIDIQGMSLDDVVTLMSIPKRLVLALRIPRGRDPQLRATYAFNQHQYQLVGVNPGSMRDAEIDDTCLDYAQQARAAPRRQLEQREQQQQVVDRLAQERSANQFDVMDPVSRLVYGPESVRTSVETLSPLHQQQKISGLADGDGEQVSMRPSNFVRAQNNIFLSGAHMPLTLASNIASESTRIQPSSLIANSQNPIGR